MMSDETENGPQIEAFSHHLMHTTPISERILINLNARELNKCATVCKFWRGIVERLRRKRCTRSWTCLQFPAGTEDIALILDSTSNFLQNLYTEPDVVFMMSESELLATTVSMPTQTRRGRRSHVTTLNYQDYVRSLLPKKCKLIGIGAGGIVGTSVDCKETHELENESVGVSFLCLPKYEGVDITVCEDIEELEGGDVKIHQFCDTLVQPTRPQCKVLMLLMSDFQAPRRYGLEMMKTMAGTLVAGAYVDEIVPLNKDKYSFIRLASVSGENVQVASVMLNDSVNNTSDAEECVKKLKRHKLPEKNSFCLMFACIGRGEGLYTEPNVESRLFKKHFPETPLIGLFGNGEIGFEIVNKGSPQPEEPESKKRKSPVTLYHSYTTILVLVSIS